MKRYRELDLCEVLRMLADDRNRTFGFRLTGDEKWHEGQLRHIDLITPDRPFYSVTFGWFSHVAEIIEIPDPLIPLKKLKVIQELHPDHEWIAMDESKEAYLFKYESPFHSENSEGMWCNGYAYVDVSGLDGYAPNWQESLIHIPTEIERIKKLETEA